MGDHRDVMEELAKEYGWQRGVELGLGGGLLFARFLALGIDMVGVDIGVRPDRKARIEALGRGTVHWMTTLAAADLVDDGWADFVFIDAAHSYSAVKSDIERWQPKVRPGGWLGGHDYNEKFPGVIAAVNEAFGSGVVLLPSWIWARA
jgi:hypothetical protein